jgi:hypothetical protein
MTASDRVCPESRWVNFAKPKIGQLRLAIFIDQDVTRLQIAMQDAVLMCMMNRQRHFAH